jgi:hypothetical protein
MSPSSWFKDFMAAAGVDLGTGKPRHKTPPVPPFFLVIELSACWIEHALHADHEARPELVVAAELLAANKAALV